MTVFNYTVNYVDIAIVAVLLIAIISGWRRGMIITVLRFLRWTVGAALCWFADRTFTPIAYETYVKPWALNKIEETITTSKNLDVVIENINKTVAELPEPVAKMIDTSQLNISGDNIAEAVLNSVFQPVLMTLTRICIIAAVIILFLLATSIIINLIRRHQKKQDEEGSLLRKTDRFFGAVTGFAKGAIVVLLVCTVLALAMQTAEQSNHTNAFFETVNTSTLFKLVNDTNPFIQ